MDEFDKILSSPSSGEEQNQQTMQKKQAELSSQKEVDPFDAILAQPDEINKKTKAPEMPAWQAGLIQFNNAFNNFGEGMAQGIASLTGDEELSSRIDQLHARRQKELQQANEVNDGWGGTAAGVAGDIGASVIKYAGLPKMAATSGAKAVLGAFGYGTAMSGMDYAENTQERGAKMLYGGILGASMGLAVEVGANAFKNALAPKDGILNYLKRFYNPKEAAAEKIASMAKPILQKDFPDMPPSEAIKKTVEAANKEGIALSPAQAIGGDMKDFINFEKTAIPRPGTKEAAKTAALDAEQIPVEKLESTISQMGIDLRAKWDTKLQNVYSAKTAAGVEPETPTSLINRRLFGNKTLRAEFLDDVGKAGGDVGKAEEIIQLLRQTQISPLKNVLEKSAGQTGGKASLGSVGAKALDYIKKMGAGEYRKTIYDIMFNGNKWADDVAEVLSKDKKNEALHALWGLIGKADRYRRSAVAGAAASTEASDAAEEDR